MALDPKNWTEIKAIGYQEPEWLIEEWLIDGESGLIVGEPKSFKSTLAIDMAVSLATGEPFLGQYKVTRKVPVLYIQEENNQAIVLPQLYTLMERTGVGRVVKVPDPSDPGGFTMEFQQTGDDPAFWLSVRTGWKAKEGDDLQEVIDFVNTHDIEYVFIDPLYKVIHGSMTHPDDAGPTMAALSKIENETKASVVLIHHANKSNQKGGSRILGSQLIWAWGANNIYMSKIKENGVSKLRVEREFRAAPEPDDIDMRFEDDFHWDIHATVYAKDGKALGDRTSDNREQYLRDKAAGLTEGQTQKDLAEHYGVSDKTIRNWNKDYEAGQAALEEL